jgi:hypothetical protein
MNGEHASIHLLWQRRPELREENILTREELKEMRRGLSQLSLEVARHAYQTAYARLPHGK